MGLSLVVRPHAIRDKKPRPSRGVPGVWLELLERRQLLSQVFVVINTSDSTDPGSLRWAINETQGDNSDNATNPDQIQFAIPTTDPGYDPNKGIWTITPSTPLTQTNVVVIDGYTQPGAKPNTSVTSDNAVIKIFLSGRGQNGDGLSVAGHSTVRGMAIGGFSGAAIKLYQDVVGGDLVEGNFLGTDPSGSVGLSDNQGVNADGPSSTIGGTTPAARNVIAAAIFADIALGTNVTGSLVQGNFIGLSASGSSVIANSTSEAGIILGAGDVPGGSGNTIGGTIAGAGNIISGIASRAIWDSEAVGHNLIQGNLIGTDSTGTIAFPNGSGIEIQGSKDTVGGTTSGSGNTIASNIGTGVTVERNRPFDPNPVGVVISGNSIYSNGKLGIDLGGDGVTPNLPGGPFGGPNNDQNYPILIAAKSSADSTTIFGTLDSVPNSRYTIQFFSNPTADPSGHGQGRVFLGEVGIETDPSGNARFNIVVPFPTTGRFITSTAMNSLGDTSEFSQDIPEGIVPIADLAVSSRANTPATTTKSCVNFSYTVTNRGPSAATNVVVTDTLPASLDGLAASASLGNFALNGNQFTDRIDSLPSGRSFTISFTGTATSAGMIADDLTAVATEVDPDPTNNTGHVLIQVKLAPTTTTLIATPNPSVVGRPVTLVATVATGGSGFSPTGSITFLIDGLASMVPLVPGPDGSSSLSMLTTSAFSAGVHQVTAIYRGDAIFAPSHAKATTQTVNRAATTTTLSASPSPSTVGQPLTFSATVSGSGPSGGTVTFFDGTTPLGLASVTSSGLARFTTSSLGVGVHAVFARFDGDVGLLPGASAAIVQEVISVPTVAPAPTVIAVQRYGYHEMPTTLVIAFDQALDPARAQRPVNYRIVGPNRKSIRVVKAIEGADGKTITLHLNQRLNVHWTYHLTIIGSEPGGLTSATGVLLDGVRNGMPGSDYKAPITIKNLVLPRKVAAVEERPGVHPRGEVLLKTRGQVK